MSAELVGNWKLVSWQVVIGDEAKDLFGTKLKGYFIVTREGRAMTPYGTYRHSRRCNIPGRYWMHSGQTRSPSLTCLRGE